MDPGDWDELRIFLAVARGESLSVAGLGAGVVRLEAIA